MDPNHFFQEPRWSIISKNIVFWLSSVFLLTSCIEIDTPKTIPVIEYSYSNSGYCEDEFGNLKKCLALTFHLEDGDGDIGLKEGDTLPPFVDEYRHNFYYNLYVLENGEFRMYDEIIANYFDLPYIEPQGQNKTLIADITIYLDFFAQTFEYDTVKLDFFIYDRQLHQSNIATTDTITFEQLPL